MQEKIVELILDTVPDDGWHIWGPANGFISRLYQRQGRVKERVMTGLNLLVLKSSTCYCNRCFYD